MKAKFKVDEHILVPKHTKLTEKEKQSLLELYKITVKDLPKIYVEDPAIQHLSVHAGDVIKIVRKSATAGEIVYYRSVFDV